MASLLNNKNAGWVLVGHFVVVVVIFVLLGHYVNVVVVVIFVIVGHDVRQSMLNHKTNPQH